MIDGERKRERAQRVARIPRTSASQLVVQNVAEAHGRIVTTGVSAIQRSVAEVGQSPCDSMRAVHEVRHTHAEVFETGLQEPHTASCRGDESE